MAYRLIEEEAPEGNKAIDFGKNVQRQIARTGSNIGTRALGLPGDILSLVNDFIARPASEAITGQKGLPYEETFLGKTIPTTEKHRQGIESFTGDYLKPHNKVEKFTDNVIEDAATLFNPTKKIKTGLELGKTGLKNLAKSLGANIVGEASEQVSGSEKVGFWTKAGTLFLASLLDKESAAKQVGKLYNQAGSNLPQTATGSAIPQIGKLNRLERDITKGRPIANLAGSEKYVMDEIDKFRNLINNGKMFVEQAWAQKRSLNEDLTKLFQFIPGKKDQQRARKLVKQMNGWYGEIIEDYGKTNPKFYKPFKEADQAFGTLAQSEWLARWAEKNIKQSPVTSGLTHLILGPIGTTVTAGAGGLAVPYQGAKLAYRMAKSPALSKIYSKMISAAAKEDAIAFNKYLNDLDEGMQQEESKEKWRFID